MARTVSVRSLALAWLILLLAGSAAARPGYQDQVVDLLVTSQRFDERRPWAKRPPRSRMGSALVVEGNRLLTEAEMIRDATLIQVEKHANARRVPARVVHVDHDVDLALLAVDEPGFFDDLEPARVAEAMPTEGVVYSVRWRNRQLEVSGSRVARIEVRKNPYGSIQHTFLLLATDLSGGGWAEPVFRDGSFIGLTTAQEGQYATVIPAEIVAGYLARLQQDEYRGFPSLNPAWQLNLDRALANFLGLEGEPRGVVLRDVPYGSTGCDELRPRDVLLGLAGHDIDALGNYRHPRYGKQRFLHILIEDVQAGDRVPARVLRDGQVLDIEIEARRYPDSSRLIPWHRNDTPPPYVVAGGLVFRELDGSYLRSWGEGWHHDAPPNLVYRYELEKETQTPERRRIVLLSEVLPSSYNVGYHDLGNLALEEINGRPVDSIAGVEEAFRHPENGLHRIRFHPADLRWEVYLDAEGFEEATAKILQDYNVPERIRLRDTASALQPVDCGN
ncbi:MAG: trypsin-like peptidase domain-containing protein [Myxococcota bacterium]|nr:trypsin-like peptidase domain-containing protein [Myxococcota bacterium]